MVSVSVRSNVAGMNLKSSDRTNDYEIWVVDEIVM